MLFLSHLLSRTFHILYSLVQLYLKLMQSKFEVFIEEIGNEYSLHIYLTTAVQMLLIFKSRSIEEILNNIFCSSTLTFFVSD